MLYFWKLPDVYVFIQQNTEDIKNGLGNVLIVSNNGEVWVLMRLMTKEELNVIFSMELLTIQDGKLNWVFNTVRGELPALYLESWKGESVYAEVDPVATLFLKLRVR